MFIGRRGLDNPGFEFRQGEETFLFSNTSRPPVWGPFIFLFNGYRRSFLKAKWPARETDHSPPSLSDVKN